VAIVKRIVNAIATMSVPIDQNCSGRSIAYTRYANAATLNARARTVTSATLDRRGG